MNVILHLITVELAVSREREKGKEERGAGGEGGREREKEEFLPIATICVCCLRKLLLFLTFFLRACFIGNKFYIS